MYPDGFYVVADALGKLLRSLQLLSLHVLDLDFLWDRSAGVSDAVQYPIQVGTSASYFFRNRQNFDRGWLEERFDFFQGLKEKSPIEISFGHLCSNDST